MNKFSELFKNVDFICNVAFCFLGLIVVVYIIIWLNGRHRPDLWV